MKITKITIGRLFNLGNYEHVRYEITVEVPEGASATDAVTGLERVVTALKPLERQNIKSASDLERAASEVERMKTLPAVEWERHYGHCTGTPSEVIARYQKSLDEETAKSQSAIARARDARRLFDNLGGAAKWKDAKLDWEDYEPL